MRDLTEDLGYAVAWLIAVIATAFLLCAIGYALRSVEWPSLFFGCCLGAAAFCFVAAWVSWRKL